MEVHNVSDFVMVVGAGPTLFVGWWALKGFTGIVAKDVGIVPAASGGISDV